MPVLDHRGCQTPILFLLDHHTVTYSGSNAGTRYGGGKQHASYNGVGILEVGGADSTLSKPPPLCP